MERVSYREYLSWQAHFRSEWNEPNRSDWYLMTICCEIRTFMEAFSKKPQEIKPKMFQLEFAFEKETPQAKKPPGGLTKEQIADIKAKMAEMAWKARSGYYEFQKKKDKKK